MSRLLIVDDEHQILELLAFTLGLHGYEVDTARGGPEALERAAALPPDLVILDVLMRPMDGFETARALRALPRAPAIVFLSGLSAPSHLAEGRTLGDAYVVKPFRPSDLVDTVEAVLAARPRATGSVAVP